MGTQSFKERVKNEVIKNAKLYNKNFINYEYLICSEAFDNGFHILKADKGNYLHLTGIHTDLSPNTFFEKCYNRTLTESDFDFAKPYKSEKSVKGSIREKIKVLPDMVQLFEKELLAQDNFKKNKVECAFATSDNSCTLGFAAAGRPKSLLRGNKLDMTKLKKVDLIFRKTRSCDKPYTELIFGEISDIKKYADKISMYISFTN